jgi:hypothetical protein
MVNLSRDVSYILKRFSHEGLQFFTVGLPQLGKSFDRALETGLFILPAGFKPSRKGSQIPAFMQVIFKSVFSESGHILEDPDPYSVQEVRQVCFLLYKLEAPYSSEKIDKVLSNFASVERELQSTFVYTDTRLFARAKSLLLDLFEGFDPLDIQPGHGPGAVASGEKGFEKWHFKTKYTTLHQKYPYYSYFIVGGGKEVCDRLSWYKGLRQQAEPSAKVVLVPKDSRGPRLISMEPLEVQYIQQGLMRKLVPWIERHRLTRGVVNFTDQTVNQQFALESSKDKEFATLDLKDASDRVRWDLVRELFPCGIVPYLSACRSTSTQLPDGSYVPLSKFAPMGSALCFPVMALTLWALIRAYLELESLKIPEGENLQETIRSSFHIGRSGSFAIYGDDLIVPSASCSGLIRMLESFSLRVNKDKSYCNGNFRESCGVDAFRGVDVTPFRMRKPFSTNARNSGFLANSSSLANSLFARGYWHAASYIRLALEDTFGKLPYGSPSAGYACIEVEDVCLAEKLNTLRLNKRNIRWNLDYQVHEYRVLAVVRKEGDEAPWFTGWNRCLCSVLTDWRRSSPLNSGVPFVPKTSFSSLVENKRRWRPVS